MGCDMTFGERLTSARNKKKLTQIEMANRVQLHRSTYAQYEVNRRNPELEKLVRIADELEISIDYLLGRSNKEQELLNALSEEEWLAITNLIEAFKK